MADKLGLYNDALLYLGSEKLASLSESNAARRALDDAWDGSVSFALESGFWNFAMRAIQADSSASVVPTFGYKYAFTKPQDWRRTHSVSASENMLPPLMDYVDEPNYWYSNSDPLFIRYVSDDVAYGLDLSIWPATFAEYFSMYLAVKTCRRISGKMPDADMKRDLQRALAQARSKDAMDEPPGFPPTGTWVNSRIRSPGSTSGTRRGL